VSPEKWKKVAHLTNESEVLEAYEQAEISMATLNLEGAKLLSKFNSRACTDVTGFGILGHANYLSLA
jgi:selenide,water dikinase